MRFILLNCHIKIMKDFVSNVVFTKQAYKFNTTLFKYTNKEILFSHSSCGLAEASTWHIFSGKWLLLSPMKSPKQAILAQIPQTCIAICKLYQLNMYLIPFPTSYSKELQKDTWLLTHNANKNYTGKTWLVLMSYRGKLCLFYLRKSLTVVFLYCNNTH